jgi:hypothetical protein
MMYCIFINMRYYVYILLDDRKEGSFCNNYCELNYQPFYIGKGDRSTKNKHERHLTHYKDVLLGNKGSDINPYKTSVIKKLFRLGYEPNFKIVFESDDENEAFKIEKELIEFYGRNIDGGVLTNITIGGSGGDTFTNNPNKEEIRLKHSLRTKGKNNPMYGRPLELNPSYLSKLSGKHWNKGNKMSDEHKNKISQNNKSNSKKIVVIDINNLEELDVLTIHQIIDKYGIKTKSLVYRCIKYGGSLNGYYFRYVDSDLILTKKKRKDYIKPKVNKTSKNVYYKKNINSNEEIKFDNVKEASKKTGFNANVIRRKCINNNMYEDIFRYGDKDYTFNVKVGNNKRGVIMIDKDNQTMEFDSLKSAADYIDGKITSVLAVCKGRNKTYKGYKFEYKNK